MSSDFSARPSAAKAGFNELLYGTTEVVPFPIRQRENVGPLPEFVSFSTLTVMGPMSEDSIASNYWQLTTGHWPPFL